MIKCPCKLGDFGCNSLLLGCDHRAFQWPTLKFPEMPTEVETLKRIHLNYRLQYLKDSKALSTVSVPLGLLRCHVDHVVKLFRILFCHGPSMMPGDPQGGKGVMLLSDWSFSSWREYLGNALCQDFCWIFFSWRGSSGSINTKTTVVHLNDETKASQMCQGLNSHSFHIIGDGHQPNSRGL